MVTPFAILDFPASPARPGGGSLLFAEPRRVLVATSLSDVRDILREVDAEVARGYHAVGFVSYEASPAFDAAMVVRAPTTLPLAWFALFDAPRPLPDDPDARAPSAEWRERTSHADYADAVEQIRAAIGRGDVYQVNYTVRLDVDIAGDTAALYRRLLRAQGPGYGARIHTGTHEILSASPELFFERRGRTIVARPMKGTARRGRWLEEDTRRANALAASDKERAENVMIVDLVRNDLGRIAEVGSVHVSQLFDVERRPTVLQMTSRITATLNAGTSDSEVFAALFPCGSVTGAPKVAATELIASLEDAPRGVYCGAIGHIAPGGTESTFSVAIRTLTIDHQTHHAEYGVGSGITWDSARAAEYDEVVAKAAILETDLPTFDLIETMRFAHGRFARVERHLNRLSISAQYFGFTNPLAMQSAARTALDAYARSATPETTARVRLCVSAGAVATLTTSPLPDAVATPLRVSLARTPIKRQNRFMYHKTTHRVVYDRHRSEDPDAFDVLLWNEDGELTEFTIGNVVVELDGVRWTPPRECGLLAGTFRDELLERGAISERVVRREDLTRATRVWLVNSVREWVLVNV